VSNVIEADGLSKRYRTRWALRECDLSIPAGHVVGLVGPNGAGKSTLLSIAVGHVGPSSGEIRVLGSPPGGDQMSKIGYVAQDAPLYADLSVADHLTLGARLNPRWDDEFARDRVSRLRLSLTDRAGRLSGGQRAQLALTIALAKRPQLVLLDEPVASLDPLARREFLDDLRTAVGDYATTVVISSHVVSDLAVICDYLIVIDSARLVATGTIADLMYASGTDELEPLVLGYLGRTRPHSIEEQS